MPTTKRRATDRPGKFIRHNGKAVAVVLTVEEYEKMLTLREPRLDARTRRSLEETRRKLERGEKVGVSIEEAFPDLLGSRSHRRGSSRS